MSTATSDQPRRVAGIDRQTIGPALLVLAFAVLMAVVLPSIDSKTSYRDAVHRGAVVAIADGLTLVPTPGWDLATGALVGHTRGSVGDTATTELIHGSVKLSVQAAPFDGTPSALLRRINKIGADLERARAATRRYPVTTRQGAAGVGEDFVGISRQGSVVAFVFRPQGRSSQAQGQPAREGVAIVVSGPKGPISRRRDDIVAMIRSIRSAS
jgi:hypothetical protein